MRVALKTLRELDAASLYRFKNEFRALHRREPSEPRRPRRAASGETDAGSSRWSSSTASTSLATCARRGWRAPPATASERSTAAITAQRAGAAPASAAARYRGAATARGPRAARPQPRVPMSHARRRDAAAQRRSASSPRRCTRCTPRARCTATSSRRTCCVTPEGRVVLLDFGLAAERRRSAITGRGHRRRHAAFMAPEQAATRDRRGRPPTGTRSA